MNRRRGGSRFYRSRSQGLTGNQLKLLGIVAILIDNLGAVVIQGGILQGMGSAAVQGVMITSSGHIWVIAGEVCRYVGRLAFPIFAFLTAEEFVHARFRGRYCLRMLVFAVLSEVPFDMAVFHTLCYPQYQNMLFTLFTGIVVMMVMEYTPKAGLRILAVAGGCAFSCFFQFDYNIIGILLIVAMYWFRRDDMAQLISGVVLCAVESISSYCISALAFVPIVLYNGRKGAFQLKYLFYVFYPAHLLALYGIGTLIAKGA